ncbi:MAG: right-handed parallel beta-helix repeat-containing protein [Treponema sp.]|nr:right-handed parallel beta-helix repeat-containing protein [Treponema sp.]
MTNKTLYSLIVIILTGCVNPLEPPVLGPEAGPNSLVIHIAGDSGGERTAYPTGAAPTVNSYTISVSRNGAVLGSLSNVMGGPYLIALTDAPAMGDMVYVEGFNSGVKTAEGVVILRADHIGGSPVTVILQPLSEGSGIIDLSISFPASFTAPDTEITAAEITLYASLTDYQAGNGYAFTRYRKNDDYGEGTNFLTATSIPLDYNSLPSGNYVVKIEFFREKFVKIKTLVQTILVRDGYTTDTWDGGSGALTLGVGDFASSNANLTDISIGGNAISGFSSATYSYSILKQWTGPESPILTISGTPGQKIEAELNGTAVSNGSALTLKKDSNTLAVSVTAPDGVTQQTYSVSHTYYNGVWYVSAAGDDGAGNGTAAIPYATVGKALAAIKAAYTGSWEGQADSPKLPVPALIQISGNIDTELAFSDADSLITITDTNLYGTLPPIILAGDGGGDDKITGGNSKRVLKIGKAHVILGDNLTITGGGVLADTGGIFTMNGGTISGNTASSGGGGVYVASSGSFTMKGGTISGNTASSGGGVYFTGSGSFTMKGGTISANTSGGGVYVNDGSFTMNGGSVSANTGGGVYVDGGGSFTISGGAISENTTSFGGGVSFTGSGSFIMSGGTISGNSGNYGGGVYFVSSNGSFVMSGGTISENSAQYGSNGVYFASSGGSFIMSGGSVSGNGEQYSSNSGVRVNDGNFAMSGGSVNANTGDGVYFASSGGSLTMNGGSVSGNTGSGVYFTGGSFAMSGGSVSGNTLSYRGGGVNVGSGDFTISGGSVSGNTAQYGVGVNVDYNSVFTMNGGSVSGNTSTGNGGGVHLNGASPNTKFVMNGGSVSGNTSTGNGGGGYVANGNFTMNGGTVSGNTASGNGGGVKVDNDAGFTMNGGSVSGNTAQYGGGVEVSGQNVKFVMSGSAVVDTGNTVYLGSSMVITLSGALSANPAANIENSGFTAGTTELLRNDIGAGDPPNYRRFLVNDAAGGIGPDGIYIGP